MGICLPEKKEIALALKREYAAVSFSRALLEDMATLHRERGSGLTAFIGEVERCCNAALTPTDAAAQQRIKNVCTQIWEATTP